MSYEKFVTVETKRHPGGVPVAVSDFGGGLTGRGAALRKLSTSGQDGEKYNEDLLQRIVYHNPEVLPLRDIEPAFCGARSICCELPLGNNNGSPTGFVDNLLITPDGGLVVVECKLIRNSEARREVVAQLLSYIAEISRLTYAELERAVVRARRSMASWDQNIDPAESLYALSGAAANDMDEFRFEEAVTLNLRRGRMLGLIVGDGLSDTVRSIADLLTHQSASPFSLGLVQLDVFRMPENSTTPYLVVPRIEARTEIIRLTVRVVDGVIVDPVPTITVEPGKSSQPKATSVSREMFFETLAANVPDQIATVQAFLDECEKVGCQIATGTASLGIRVTDRDGRNWTLGNLYKNGDVEIYGLNLKDAMTGANLGNDYMASVAALVPNAFVRPPSDPSKGARVVLKTSGGWPQVADLMAVRVRWLDLIRDMAENVAQVPPEE